MKVNGFLKDVTGANRVIKARRQLIQSGSPENLYKDHIREVAEEVHPNKTHVRITKVEEVSPTARKFTFVPEDDCHHPALLHFIGPLSGQTGREILFRTDHPKRPPRSGLYQQLSL